VSIVKSFVQPVFTRWKYRNLCPCEEPASMRCTKHHSKLCGSRLCIAMHRWAHGDETCTIQALRGPLDYAIYALGTLVVVLFMVMVAVRWESM
jgi:hypothetical protein